jgi:hypothetical protein
MKMMTRKTKLLESIDAKLTGRKIPVDLDYTRVELFIKEKHDEIPFNYADEYRISVHLGCAVQIDSALSKIEKEQSINYALKSVGRGISNEVYGEVRDKLIKLAIQLKYEGKFGSPTHDMIEELIEMVTYG